MIVCLSMLDEYYITLTFQYDGILVMHSCAISNFIRVEPLHGEGLHITTTYDACKCSARASACALGVSVTEVSEAEPITTTVASAVLNVDFGSHRYGRSVGIDVECFSPTFVVVIILGSCFSIMHMTKITNPLIIKS